jgi:hypothetical protein
LNQFRAFAVKHWSDKDLGLLQAALYAYAKNDTADPTPAQIRSWSELMQREIQA